MRTHSLFTRFSPVLLGVLTAATLTATQALAGSSADMAENHLEAIANGDTAALASHYGTDAVFQWVGGPLDGVYAGKDAINALWGKFAKVQGKLGLDILSLEESANDKGVTVNAAVKFQGKKAIPVRYIMVYRGGKLVNEVWQIDPNLQANKY